MDNQINSVKDEPYLKEYHRIKYGKTEPKSPYTIYLSIEEREALEVLARRFTRGNKMGLIRLMLKTWKPTSYEVVVPGIEKE